MRPRDGATGRVPAPLVLHGELSIVARPGGCASLVLDYFSPGQRDLVQAIRERIGPAEHGFGEERFGRVSIVVRPLPPAAPAGDDAGSGAAVPAATGRRAVPAGRTGPAPSAPPPDARRPSDGFPPSEWPEPRQSWTEPVSSVG